MDIIFHIFYNVWESKGLHPNVIHSFMLITDFFDKKNIGMGGLDDVLQLRRTHRYGN